MEETGTQLRFTSEGPCLSPTVPWAPGTVKGAAARDILDYRVVEHHQY